MLKPALIEKRIVLIDLLRGYFLVVIIIDHLARYPGLFEFFTGEGFLWSSAAEGFFFISGVMIGLIRGRKELEKPFKEVTRKLLSRTLVIYLTTVGCTLFFTWLAVHNSINEQVKPGWETFPNDIALLWNSFTLQYVYGWTDFLQHYITFFLVSPIIIYLLRKNKWWVVAIVSILAWYFLRLTYQGFGWQLYFVSGCLIGFYLPELQKFVKNLSRNFKKIVVTITSIATVITLIASVISIFFVQVFQNTQYYSTIKYWSDTLSPLFDKWSMPPLRILIFFLWFFTLFLLFRKFENAILKYFGNIFILFSQNSLFVYVIHSFFVVFVDLWIPKTDSLIENFVIICTVIISVWIITKYKVKHFYELKHFLVKNFIDRIPAITIKLEL